MKTDLRNHAAAAAVSANAAALIAAATRTLEPVRLANDTTIQVRGLTVLEVLKLIQRFPTMRATMLRMFGIAGGQADLGDVSIAAIVIDEGADFIAAMVAAAAGEKGNADVEAAIAAMDDEDLIDLVEVIVRLTMPEGLEGFFEKLGRMAERVGLKAEEKAEADETTTPTKPAKTATSRKSG